MKENERTKKENERTKKKLRKMKEHERKMKEQRRKMKEQRKKMKEKEGKWKNMKEHERKWNAQRETTLRPPLRRRCAMGEQLTPIRNWGGRGYGTITALHHSHSSGWSQAYLQSAPSNSLAYQLLCLLRCFASSICPLHLFTSSPPLPPLLPRWSPK